MVGIRVARLFTVLGLLGLAACVPQAQPRSAEPVTREVTGLAGADARVFAPRPAFKVEAVSFEALDETGPDFPADDDVYAVFIDGSPREQFTETFKSVDVGEVQYFRPGPRCISPVHQCAERGRVDGLSFGISLWEEDQLPFWEFNPGCFPYDFCRWESGINPKDDLIGRKELAFSEAELIAAMPNVGDTVEHVIDLMGFSCDPPPGGACAGPFSGPHYLFTYRITRMPDIDAPTVAPVVVPIWPFEARDVLTRVLPRFKVEALYMHALDETGTDWLGSDEVYAVFVDGGLGDEVTPKFGNVDTGSYLPFPEPICITPMRRCEDGLSRGVYFGVALYESDGGSATEYVRGSHAYFNQGLESSDHLIGRAFVSLPEPELLAMLPVPGTTMQRELSLFRCPNDASVCGEFVGHYSLTYRITRLPDLALEPPLLDMR